MCEAAVRVQIIKNHAKNVLNKAQPQQMKILSVKSSPTSICLSSSPARATNFHELIQAKIKRNKNIQCLRLLEKFA